MIGIKGDRESGMSFSSHFLVSDMPTSKDLLGFSPSVRALAKLLSSPRTQTPLTVSVHGYWGTGKTSFLKMLERRLNRNQHIITLWFDLWQEAFSQRPTERLIQRLVMLQPKKKSAITIGITLLRSLADYTLRVVTQGRLDATMIEAHAQKAENELFGGSLETTQSIAEKFSNLVTEVVGEEGRLIVLVDDLDRCAIEKVSGLLDDIHHFFFAPRVIFVVAADIEMIRKAYAARYNTYAGTEHAQGDNPLLQSVEYVEKLFQLQTYVPIPRVNDLQSYGKSLFEGMPGDTVLLDHLAMLPRNPRMLKLLRNQLLMILEYARNARHDTAKAIQFSKWLLLKHACPWLVAQASHAPELLLALQDVAVNGQTAVLPTGVRMDVQDIKAKLPAEILGFLKREPHFDREGLAFCVMCARMEAEPLSLILEHQKAYMDVLNAVRIGEPTHTDATIRQLSKLPRDRQVLVLQAIIDHLPSFKRHTAKCAAFHIFNVMNYADACPLAWETVKNEQEPLEVRVWAASTLVRFREPGLDPILLQLRNKTKNKELASHLDRLLISYQEGS